MGRSNASGPSTTRSRRSDGRRSASSTHLCARRFVSAPTSSAFMDSVPAHAQSNESVELVRRARLERAVPFTNAVMRRLAVGLEGLLAALGEATARGRGSSPLVSRLGGRDLVARAGARRRGRPDARPERAAGDRSSGTAAPQAPRAVEADPRRWLETGWAGLRAAAPSWRATPSARSPASASSTSAPPPAARRPARGGRDRGRRGREAPGPSARARRERGAARSAERPGRLSPTRSICPTTRRLRPGPRRRAMLGPRRARVPARPSLAARAAPRAATRASRARSRGSAGRDAHVLGLHDQRGRERGGRRRSSAPPSTTSAPSGPTSAIRGARVPPDAAAPSIARPASSSPASRT